MQASDEGIALLGMLVEGLGGNGLYRRQGILDAMLHLVHKQLLPLLSPLALGDIPGNFGSADDSSVGLLEWRYRQRNIDQTSVLAATDGIIMINALAPPYALKDLWFLTYTIFWNQDRDRFADDLFGCIAEQPLGTSIPTSDNALETLATIDASRCASRSARSRSLISTSMFTAPMRVPELSYRGVG